MMQHIQLEFLWTDILLYLVLTLSGITFLVTLRKSSARGAWLQIFQRPLSMIAFWVLTSFIIIALLDSLHYHTALARMATPAAQQRIQYSPKLYSLLDKLIAPLGEHHEKTYAAPFATQLFAREFIVDARGITANYYPTLQYNNNHAGNSMLNLVSIGLIKGATLWLGTWLIMWYCCIMATKIMHFSIAIAWKTAAVTTLVIIIISSIAWELATHYYIFGTDKVGQDVFYMTIKSIRTGMVIGTITTMSMLPFAIFLGIIAGYFGGITDDIIQYIYTTISSIPGVLLITAAVLSMQIFMASHQQYFHSLAQIADARLLALCLILGLTSWTSLCRLLRAETLKIRESDYIQAATALGSSVITIIFKHIIPNVMHIVLITTVLDFSFLVLAEAVLSYVGVGVSPTTISWGNMINSARLELAREPVVWWPMLAAFSFMFVLVLSGNIFADAVRDAFDPRTTARHE